MIFEQEEIILGVSIIVTNLGFEISSTDKQVKITKNRF
jgi:hypothetical protein